MQHRLLLAILVGLAGCGKKVPTYAETKLGDSGLSIGLPAGATVKAETPTTFSIDQDGKPLGLINDSGLTDWPDASTLQAACADLGDPKPFETANMRGVSCSKDGKFRTLAYVKVYNAKTKNIQSCNIDSEEGYDICMTLGGPRGN